MIKICIKCEILKDISEYAFRNDSQKHRNICKECRKAQGKKYYKIHEDKIKNSANVYYKNNTEYVKSRVQKYAANNREKTRKWRSDFEKRNKNKISEYKKMYFRENFERLAPKRKLYRDSTKHIAKAYRDKNKEILKQKQTEYYKLNKENRCEQSREYAKREEVKIRNNCRRKERMKTDIQFLIKTRLRGRMHSALKNRKDGLVKADRTIALLGCDYNFFKKYIEKLFTEGMTWEKLISAEIEIDHIKPCSKFDLTKEEEQYKCFHYSNLQPLWWRDNITKGDKYNYV